MISDGLVWFRIFVWCAYSGTYSIYSAVIEFLILLLFFSKLASMLVIRCILFLLLKASASANDAYSELSVAEIFLMYANGSLAELHYRCKDRVSSLIRAPLSKCGKINYIAKLLQLEKSWIDSSDATTVDNESFDRISTVKHKDISYRDFF